MPEPDRHPASTPLLHPVFVAALALLAVNDHLLKPAFPGLLTGKLSDVAALIVVPPLVVEIARLAAGSAWTTRLRTAAALAGGAGVAALLVAVKLDPVANTWYATLLGLVQWPVMALVALLAGAPLPGQLLARTVLDAGDLVALPAAAVGAWVAAGAPRPDVSSEPWQRGGGRLALIAASVFILAATSQSPPTTVTAIRADEVLLAPGDPPVHRRLTVTVSATARTSSGEPDDNLATSVEARMRWPRVAPPARFEISRVASDGTLGPAVGSILQLDPSECSDGCSLLLDVAVDWPNADGRPPSSVPWELAVTSRTTVGYIQGGIAIDGDTAASTARKGNALLLGGLAVLPFVALTIGGRRRKPGDERGLATQVDWVVAGSVAALVVGLAALPLIGTGQALEPAAGRAGILAIAAGPMLAAAVALGLVRWWQGHGDLLAIVLLGGSLVALLFGARLIGEASETFLVRGLQVAALATALASVGIAGAVARPGRPQPLPGGGSDAAPNGIGRIAVAGILVALLTGLLAVAFPVGLLLGLGVQVWWTGRGHLLGLACFFIGGGLSAWLLFIGGPALFGPRFSAFEQVSIVLAGLATFVGFMAALGAVGRHPARPVATAPVPFAPDEAKQPAD